MRIRFQTVSPTFLILPRSLEPESGPQGENAVVAVLPLLLSDLKLDVMFIYWYVKK